MSEFVLKWRIAAALSAAGLVAACSVADSLHVDPAGIHASAYSPAVPTLCRSTLGSYALPKSFLRVKVERKGDAAPELTKLEPIIRADKSLTFCLDHIVDPLADDEIRIIKSSGQLDKSYAAQGKEQPDIGTQFPVIDNDIGNKDYGSQLLQWVVSNTVDQSEYIAKTLVRTAFIGLSGNANFTPLGRDDDKPGTTGPAKTTVALLEYDPFDPEDSALHNQRLRDLGYCLVLENYTFDARQMSVEQYCSAPRHVPFAFDEAYVQYRSGPPPRIAGIAYRPRVNYALSVYKNDKPKGRGRWKLYQQQRVAFENISPIVSIGLTRSIFAARRVALKFHKGTLESMCLVKTSELQSAVAVPYEIARSIVALPTQIFEVKIGNISDNAELLRAETAVVTAQKEYLDFLTGVSRDFSNTKKGFVPLPGKDDPKAIQRPSVTVPNIEESASATLATLQSSAVLNQICKDAPSVIKPDAPTPGARL